MHRYSSANVPKLRQRTQYTCMACSLSASLQAIGIECDEDTVNRVMGARPMQGASWEQAFAAAQHFGARTHLICPATLKQLKEFTDKGTPVMIAWNPEGRPWSHASVVFDVDADENIHIVDPNIPDPDQTVRVLPKEEFYKKWYEKASEEYLIRRPAMAVEREITEDGRQVVASTRVGVFEHRKLWEIAEEIAADLGSWRGGKISPYAKPYLDALRSLDSIEDMYYADSASTVVAYFLANVKAYQGPKAKELKAELKKILDDYYRRHRVASSLTQPLRTRRDYGSRTAEGNTLLYFNSPEEARKASETLLPKWGMNIRYAEGGRTLTAFKAFDDPAFKHITDQLKSAGFEFKVQEKTAMVQRVAVAFFQKLMGNK